MIIKWLGHASFLIETGQVRIVTDPFDEYVGYKMPEVTGDLVTCSHAHKDHTAVSQVKGQPAVINSRGDHQFRGIKIHGTPTFHDNKHGKERGSNLVFTFKSENITLCHMGDLGHIPDSQQLMEIGKVDILLIPVGGLYTISAEEAVQVKNLFKPRLTIPMHYKTPDLNFPVAPVEDFIMNFNSVIKLPYLEINQQDSPSLPEVVILDRYRI